MGCHPCRPRGGTAATCLLTLTLASAVLAQTPLTWSTGRGAQAHSSHRESSTAPTLSQPGSSLLRSPVGSDRPAEPTEDLSSPTRLLTGSTLSQPGGAAELSSGGADGANAGEAKIRSPRKLLDSQKRSIPGRALGAKRLRPRQTIRVGGPRGFDFYTALNWTVPAVYEGDRLWFVAPKPRGNAPNLHNVYLMLNRNAYTYCDFNGARPIGGPNYTTPRLTPGMYYYACGCCAGDYYHCAAYQKVAVRVRRRQ